MSRSESIYNLRPYRGHKIEVFQDRPKDGLLGRTRIHIKDPNLLCDYFLEALKEVDIGEIISEAEVTRGIALLIMHLQHATFHTETTIMSVYDTSKGIIPALPYATLRKGVWSIL